VCDALTTAAITLWRAHGGPAGEISAEPLLAGRNGRVLRLVAAGGMDSVVAKSYFDDGFRDRLGSEWAFLSHADKLGVPNVPRAITRDSAANLGLYQFIPGSRFSAGQIGKAEVVAAANFVRALNAKPSGIVLPEASDSAFSIAGHLAHTNRRFERLSGLDPQEPVDQAAKELVAEIELWWTRLKVAIATRAGTLGFDLQADIPAHERVISPSDFGFHNALRQRDGSIVFLDFEYAGWDDIAKLVADFFCQPEISVPPALFDCFVDTLLEGRPAIERTRARIDLVRPIFGIKWCCILLNIFVPGFASRGRFADPDFETTQRKDEQLQKAIGAFRALRETSWPI
jgi:hypothetical protein